jgi:RNA polymerase sigma-70 factor (ECF subfamily)
MNIPEPTGTIFCGNGCDDDRWGNHHDLPGLHDLPGSSRTCGERRRVHVPFTSTHAKEPSFSLHQGTPEVMHPLQGYCEPCTHLDRTLSTRQDALPETTKREEASVTNVRALPNVQPYFRRRSFVERPTTTCAPPPAHLGQGPPASETGVPPVTPQGADVALLQRVAAQDRQAFDTVYARYVPRLRRYLRRFLDDPARAEDVCQDVMLVVWQQAWRFPATVPLFAWLCGIARHKARTAWTRTASRAPASAGPTDSQVADPESLLLWQEAGQVLEQALDTLPFYERTALRLLMQQGYSYQEIAVMMDTPVSTVRTRLWRACHRLHAHMVGVDAALPPSRPLLRVSGEGQTLCPPASDTGRSDACRALAPPACV